MRQKSTTIGFVLAMALASGMAGAQTTPTAPAGEKTPIADNTTAEGKQANRRVEVAIYANEKMKKAAEEGRL